MVISVLIVSLDLKISRVRSDVTHSACPFNQGTQNIEVDYAALTADALGAEYHIQCWSGKGTSMSKWILSAVVDT
jgi:hypothetical protein